MGLHRYHTGHRFPSLDRHDVRHPSIDEGFPARFRRTRADEDQLRPHVLRFEEVLEGDHLPVGGRSPGC